MIALSNAIHYILDLGPAVMMPAFITILGLLLGQGFAKSFRAGLTVGVGFVAIGLVVGLLVGVVGPQAMAFADVLGLKLDVLDVGWPMGAAVSFASPIAAALIPTVLVLNILLVLAKVTRTVDVDLWNYWHFIYAGALVQTATGSLALGVGAACITAVVVLKLADWTQPAVEKFFGLPDISLPHTETVNWAPLMFALDRLARMAAVLVVLPKVVAILMWRDIDCIHVRRFVMRDRVLIRIAPSPAFRGRYWILESIEGFAELLKAIETRGLSR